MASIALLPPKFQGLMSENGEAWLNDFQHYAVYKKLDDAGKLGLVPLLFKDGARYWFDALNDQSKDTFEHLATAFRNEFKRDESIKWRDSADVWAVTQLPSQTVEDFVTKVQQKALTPIAAIPCYRHHRTLPTKL